MAHLVAVLITVYLFSLALDLVGFAVKPDFEDVFDNDRKACIILSVLPIINTRTALLIWWEDNGSSRLM